jgi:hypothetical protein
MGAKELDDLYKDFGLRGWFPLGIFFLLHIIGMAAFHGGVQGGPRGVKGGP